MAGLLVSVRSVEEARSALEGGASVIDVKEPDLGPLGRAGVAIWRAVRHVVPPSIAMSVALGELRDWKSCPSPEDHDFAGIAFRKLGLAGAGRGWKSEWAAIRRDGAAGPPWVAVAYADWQAAEAPEPTEVLSAAIEAPDCAGVLVDTWEKQGVSPLDGSPFWSGWIDRAHQARKFVALAGGLDREAILRLAPLRPDLFAVRGSACVGGNRLGKIEAGRVARLVRATHPDE
ncbi:(5-formylfuran-3-yl)methyl phosphate synthase [Tundrisphaera lichenicola]|uniref:(5-formylfuran-3-yl)methyl phosphate synthase n=1 Tax=Tundrisphaera lichenicola TaxID=2029860 RepID=UPI003EB7F51F